MKKGHECSNGIDRGLCRAGGYCIKGILNIKLIKDYL